MKFLILLAFLFGCNYSKLGDISESTRVPTKDYVLIDSNGGETHYASKIAKEMLEKTCVVKKAKSAALQIILPACKERYYLPGASLQFHSAGVDARDLAKLKEFHHLSEPLLMVLLVQVQEINEEMVNLMIMSGIPLNSHQIYTALVEEITLSGSSLEILHPWILPISECSHCPR